MRALGMRAKWLKHEWLWKVRWAYLLAFGVVLTVAPILSTIALHNAYSSDGKEGLMIGFFCGLLFTWGILLVRELYSYAIRRVKVGKNLAKHDAL